MVNQIRESGNREKGEEGDGRRETEGGGGCTGGKEQEKSEEAECERVK